MQDPVNPPRPSPSTRRSGGGSRYSNDVPRTPGSAREHNQHSSSTRSRTDNDHTSQQTPQAAPMQPIQAKKRTTITMQTGTWSLGKTIGAGSMGKVKIAKNLETGETCAIKIIPRSSTDEHKTAQERERADHSKEIRTAREAAIVTLLNHPYICGMRDFVRTHYHWYMLFEYVNGGQMLDYIISHGKLKEKVAKKFGRQIASALDYCHRNSIVHRDLKIENILISKAGDIKIIDFGLSNLFSPRSHLKTFCGSLYFAAPELLNAKAYTGPEVDVWSFGIVLYVLVCGKVPFDDQSMPQLHAKIKKGVVDWPTWLTPDCKNLLSRMLVTDPKQRITLVDVMNHAWMTKGFNGPPESYLPQREPIQLPLDSAVVEKMHGFDFGSTEHISKELTRVIDSEEYQHAVQMKTKEVVNPTSVNDKKKGVFDFYKRRNSISSREALQTPSSEALQLGQDPINAYSPLLSIYYLAREKIEREHVEANPGGLKMPTSVTSEKPLKISDLPPPEPAYTNSNAYEMSGEKATGGRSRPRARTHGEDEICESLKKTTLKSNPPSPAIVTNLAPPQSKKESMAGGLLRRFSTRRGRDTIRDHPPPALQLQPPNEATSLPRKSFSVRRSKTKDSSSPMMHSSGSQPNRADLLSPPYTDGQLAKSKSGSRILNRSTSVNSGSFRRRRNHDENEAPANESAGEPPATSGSDRSEVAATPRVKISEPEPSDQKPPRSATLRTKSLGHARRESIQARRSRREGKQQQIPEDTDIGEETEGEGPGEIKPLFLRGLFSVSTTSSKPVPIIRNDIIRVLRQLGVEYTEIKAGFSCRHAPSIDLKSVTEASPASPEKQQFTSPTHRRRISFGVFHSGDKERDEVRDLEKSPQPQSAGRRGDSSFAVSDESDNDQESRRRHRDRQAGETTTHVDNDLGENLVLHFEILLVKVPLLSLHGIQFKKVAGGTWQYKNMAQKILDALRL